MIEPTGVLGVLGGMGPLASMEFVRNIYRLSPCEREQDMPRVVLDSDAGFPDRTTAIRLGRHAELAARLETRIRGLLEVGATRVVVACFTAHNFFPLISPEVRAAVVSLVDITVEEIRRREGSFLMLCTEGTARTRLFQGASAWPLVADRVRFPLPEDQHEVHDLIYRMKVAGAGPEVLRQVDELRERYDCTGVIGGCTEFHLVVQELLARYGPVNVVDGLHTVALDPFRAAAPALPIC